METTNAAAVAAETTANVTEIANQSVTANANADYMQTRKITSRVSRVRTITTDDAIEYVILQLNDEFDSMIDGEITKTHDVICNPWHLTNQLCDCSDLFAMLASCDALSAKDFACLASATVTFVRTYHNAGDDYVRYDGTVEQYAEDGFMFELTNLKLSALGEKLLMNRLS